MAAIYVERRAFVAAFLSANPRCQFRAQEMWGAPVPEAWQDCRLPSQDVHEVIRRSHGGALYPGQPKKRSTGYLALCRKHHDWVTTHPLEARELAMDER